LFPAWSVARRARPPCLGATQSSPPQTKASSLRLTVGWRHIRSPAGFGWARSSGRSAAGHAEPAVSKPTSIGPAITRAKTECRRMFFLDIDGDRAGGFLLLL